MIALDPFSQLAEWWPILRVVAYVVTFGLLLIGFGLVAFSMIGAGRIDPDTTTRRMRRAIGPMATGGVLALVVFGIPAIVEVLPRVSPAAAGTINATITVVSLAVIAVCSVLLVRRSSRRQGRWR